MSATDSQISHHKAVFRITKVKAAKGGSVVIEGYANRAKDLKGGVIIDRGNEYIPPEEWRLDEWLANPQVFFDHREHFKFPIGKGLDAKIKKDGLWVKVQISDSEDPAISRIRDLIREGVLKTFSAGFDCQEEPQPDGVMVLRNCILREVSVVSIPMNQGSFFELVGKAKAYWTDTPLAQIRVDLMRCKGARVAAMVQEQIGKMEAENRFDHEAFMEECAKSSKYTAEEVHAAMTGEQNAVPDGILAAFSDLLQINAAELREANTEDVANPDAAPLEDAPAEEAADQEEDGDELESAADTTPPPDTQEKPAEEVKADQPPGAPEESDAEPTAAHKKCYQEEVLQRVVTLIDEGKDQDEAIQACIKTWRKKMLENYKTDVVLLPEMFAEIYKTTSDHIAKKKSVPGDVDQGQAATAANQQTNVLLGQLIAEIQMMSKKLEWRSRRPLRRLSWSQSQKPCQTPMPSCWPKPRWLDALTMWPG
jgi:HK97 family phage prohead protease